MSSPRTLLNGIALIGVFSVFINPEDQFQTDKTNGKIFSSHLFSKNPTNFPYFQLNTKHLTLQDELGAHLTPDTSPICPVNITGLAHGLSTCQMYALLSALPLSSNRSSQLTDARM